MTNPPPPCCKMPMGTRKTAGPQIRTIRKAPARVCERGHRVGIKWKPGGWCAECFAIVRAEEEAMKAIAERDGWASIIGPPPDDMTMTAGTGEVIRFTIPKGMRRRRARR